MKKIISVIVAFVAMAVVFSCSEDENNIYMYVPVEGIAIQDTETMFIGDTLQFTPTFTPVDITNPTVYWTIKDAAPEGCLTIDANGLAVAVAEGVATVVVTPTGQTFTSECIVTIEYAPVAATAIEFASDVATEIAVGNSVSFNYVVTPETADDYQITWSLEDVDPTGCAEVDTEGNVSTSEKGNVTLRVTATNGDGTSVSATTSIAIVDGVQCTSITIPSSASVTNGFTTTLSVTEFEPSNATDKTVTWSIVSGDEYIEIDSDTGVVTGKAIGTATVIATANDGSETKSNECTVEVVEATNLIIDPGFEESFTYWTNSSTAVIESTNVITGEHSVRFTTTNSYTGWVRQVVTVEPGATYKMGFTGRAQASAGAEGSSDAKGYLRMQLGLSADLTDLSSTFTQLSDSETAEIDVNVNTEVAVEVTIPEDYGTSAVINIFKTAGICYADDTYLIRID